MRPLILSIFALFLAGCTHSQQSMVDTFRASLFDNQDITVADQQIQALPYSTMYLRLNEGATNLCGTGIYRTRTKQMVIPG